MHSRKLRVEAKRRTEDCPTQFEVFQTDLWDRRLLSERLLVMAENITAASPPTYNKEQEKACTTSQPGAFSFFRAPAKSVKPCKSPDVKGIYKYITLYAPAMEATRKLRSIKDKDEARKFKGTHFDFVCFSGTFSYRKDDCLIAHSGLLSLDFDHVGNPMQLWALREKLIADPYFTTWLLFTSPSGDGLKWVVSIDLAKCDHATWFRALQNYIRATYGEEVDEKCSNVSRTCFLPHDGSCYVNPIILQEPDVCPF